MNRENLNYASSAISINNNSNLAPNYPRSSNFKDYSTLNSIHLTSGIYNASEKEENKEIIRMKISFLLTEVKNVIDNPEYTLNFQLVHMKCFNLNQLGLQIEFFEMLKNCLLNKLKYYVQELTSFNNSVKHQLKINIDNSLNNINNPNCKKFLNSIINKYEEYKRICLKISDTISILDLKSHYLNKYKLVDEENLCLDYLSNKLDNKSEIAKMNFVFKILFSLFFETLLFDENIQGYLTQNLSAAYKKIRNNFYKYVSFNKEIDEYISTFNNSQKKINRINNSDDSSMGNSDNYKNISSNLKLNENTIEHEKDSNKYNNIDKSSISNFANFKKDDPIFKIKGILQKKKLLENKNYLTLQNNSNPNKNLIELNENTSTGIKQQKMKIPLPECIKAIFNISNDALSISFILNKEKLDNFISKFDERFVNDTKAFYADYCKNYFENIKRLENLNKGSTGINNINHNVKGKNKKEKFSHYDISILNYKSDNENPIEISYIKEKTVNVNQKNINNNSNLIDLDLNVFKNNQEDKLFINKKIPKENNLKSAGDMIKNHYNTFCVGENDIINEKDVYCNFDSSTESCKNNPNRLISSKFKLKNNKNIAKKHKNRAACDKIPVSIEGFILQITQLISLESELYCNYEKKGEILTLILEQTLDEYETSLSEALRKFIDALDLAIIKFLFSLYSKSETFKEKFNKLLNNNIISVLSDLEKNHIILNRYHRVEYVNFLFFVEEIFETKKKFYLILKESLNSYSRSELIIKTSLEKTVNKNFDFMENFVKLLHDEIKIAIKNKNQYRLKEFNEKFLAIYKLFNEKDLFEIEYRKYLSKRLLRNSSMVRETEYDFYEMLRKESGAIYTRKIEKILDEISVSYDLNVEYSQKYAGNITKNLLCSAKPHNSPLAEDQYNNVSATSNFKNNLSSYNNLVQYNPNSHLAFCAGLNRNSSNYFSSINAEEDKNSSGLESKPSNFSNLNSHISHSGFGVDLKQGALEHNNNNNIHNFNFNNFTPLNVNSGNNIISMMNSISVNSGKNQSTRATVNSIIFKSNTNNHASNKPLNSYLIQNPKGLVMENPTLKQLENPNNFIDINVKVVSSDCWLLENINIKNNKRLNISEVKKNEEFNLPQVLDKYIQNFTEFYCNKFKNRQLKWIHEYSYAFMDMKGCNGKVYNIIASNYQMSFLCLFNKNKSSVISFREILNLLNVKAKDNKNYMQLLKSHFLPIFNCKLFLIKNREKYEISEIEDNDLIYFNPNFDQEESKIRLLNSIVEKKELVIAEEKKEAEVSHFVLEDRKHQLDAIIIRVLKRNKIVDFEKLKTLITEEIRKFFIPETKFIKTRLENLIDRNFVKRNEEDHNCYEYI